ncbi:MAG: response regulator [Longimicrobiales bacterium]|nr:response regulator [Longimicrobiales bacterium]
MKPRIAVVEDNPDNRFLVQALLEDLYDLSEYESGTSAIEGLVQDNPDLVLLDISLPDMGGTDVLRWMRDQVELKTTPVVALTAHAMAGDRDRFLAEGFSDYVTKPIVDESILMETIARWLTSPE